MRVENIISKMLLYHNKYILNNENIVKGYGIFMFWYFDLKFWINLVRNIKLIIIFRSDLVVNKILFQSPYGCPVVGFKQSWKWENSDGLHTALTRPLCGLYTLSGWARHPIAEVSENTHSSKISVSAYLQLIESWYY